MDLVELVPDQAVIVEVEAAKALGEEDAQTFIDSVIPDAMERLAEILCSASD